MPFLRNQNVSETLSANLLAPINDDDDGEIENSPLNHKRDEKRYEMNNFIRVELIQEAY